MTSYYSNPPEKPKYRQYRMLKRFVLQEERYAFFYAVLAGFIHCVPKNNRPQAFKDLLTRDILMYKAFESPEGELMLGVFPTTGKNMGSALCYSIFAKQIEEFFDHQVVDSHDYVKWDLADKLRVAGLKVETEKEVEYSKQTKKRRVRKRARWDIYLPDSEQVIEIETGSNLGSRIKAHIESALALKKDLTFYIPRIKDEPPLPRMGWSGISYPSEPANDNRSRAARYINFLTQMVWRTLMPSRKLPEVCIDFCYNGELARAVEIHRGKVFMTYDKASEWQQRFFRLPPPPGKEEIIIEFDRETFEVTVEKKRDHWTFYGAVSHRYL